MDSPILLPSSTNLKKQVFVLGLSAKGQIPVLVFFYFVDKTDIFFVSFLVLCFQTEQWICTDNNRSISRWVGSN